MPISLQLSYILYSNKHIFFDLDRTLWDFDRNSEAALRQIITEENLIPQVESFERFHKAYERQNAHLWKLYGRGKIKKDELRYERFRSTFQKFKIRDAMKEELGLSATGFGLAVALPAVMGYNWLTRSNRVLTAKLDAFAFELLTKVIRRARAATWEMGRAGVSSMYKGQLSSALAASTKRRNSPSVMSPRRICSEGTSEASDKIRAANCSALISKLKNPTAPPSTAPSLPSWVRPRL